MCTITAGPVLGQEGDLHVHGPMQVLQCCLHVTRLSDSVHFNSKAKTLNGQFPAKVISVMPVNFLLGFRVSGSPTLKSSE
jgi:hypothetical protein